MMRGLVRVVAVRAAAHRRVSMVSLWQGRKLVARWAVAPTATDPGGMVHDFTVPLYFHRPRLTTTNGGSASAMMVDADGAWSEVRVVKRAPLPMLPGWPP